MNAVFSRNFSHRGKITLPNHSKMAVVLNLVSWKSQQIDSVADPRFLAEARRVAVPRFIAVVFRK